MCTRRHGCFHLPAQFSEQARHLRIHSACIVGVRIFETYDRAFKVLSLSLFLCVTRVGCAGSAFVEECLHGPPRLRTRGMKIFHDWILRLDSARRLKRATRIYRPSRASSRRCIIYGDKNIISCTEPYGT